MVAKRTKRLVIVESPAKARKIGGYLGKDFTVMASMGHVRDLPANASEIPEEIKQQKKPWASLGVNVEAGFEPLYVVPKDKKKIVSQLKAALKDASGTDPGDRRRPRRGKHRLAFEPVAQAESPRQADGLFRNHQ